MRIVRHRCELRTAMAVQRSSFPSLDAAMTRNTWFSPFSLRSSDGISAGMSMCVWLERRANKQGESALCSGRPHSRALKSWRNQR